MKSINGTPLTPGECIALATRDANLAGDKWMAEAQPRYKAYQTDILGNKLPGTREDFMLDVCGNAHVQFRDKRTADYKNFSSSGRVRASGNAVLEIDHKYRGRQEMGLQVVCAEAAQRQLEACGVTGLRIWSYID